MNSVLESDFERLEGLKPDFLLVRCLKAGIKLDDIAGEIGVDLDTVDLAITGGELSDLAMMRLEKLCRYVEDMTVRALSERFDLLYNFSLGDFSLDDLHQFYGRFRVGGFDLLLDMSPMEFVAAVQDFLDEYDFFTFDFKFLRKKVKEFYDAGIKQHQMADAVGVSRSRFRAFTCQYGTNQMRVHEWRRIVALRVEDLLM